MKQLRRFLAPVLCIALLSGMAMPASALIFGWNEVPSTTVASFAKNGLNNQVIPFTEDDFTSQVAGSDTLESITILTLPSSSIGTLRLGDEEVFPGVSISRNALDGLRFHANTVDETAVQITFMPVFSAAAGTAPVTVTLHLLKEANSKPVAQNLSLKTYKNIPITCRFQAVDPDGDTLTFQLTDKPARGEVIFDAADPYTFIYAPYDNKTGKDSFTYVAIDPVGNVSAPATVQIVIEKQSTQVTYADMEGSSAHRAAIRLAEAGIFIGERQASQYFFRPDTEVTRADFIATALSAAGITELSTVSRTGFADDDAIPTWARPYAATALKAGVIQGLTGETGQIEFSADAPITLAEATVMLNRMLQLSDTKQEISCVDSGDVPTWAYQAAANLGQTGILATDSTGALRLSSTLTRGEMAELLCSALDYMENRTQNQGFLWS